jgi:hypothetical protein
MNHHNEKQAQNVYDDVALATQGALAPDHNRGSPFFGRLHRLTVDNSSARLPIAAMGFPHIPAQSVV